MFGKRSSQGSNTTIIGRGARFAGTLELEGDIHVEGQCEGTIRSQSQLSVGAHGAVSGELSANVIVVAGKVDGTAIAKETLHVLATGSLQGDIFYGRLQVDSGGVIDGRSHQGPPPPMLAATTGGEATQAHDGEGHDESSVFDARSKRSSVAPNASVEGFPKRTSVAPNASVEGFPKRNSVAPAAPVEALRTNSTVRR